MEAFGLLIHGFAVLLTWKTIVLMMVGLVLGIFVGVLPGLGGPNGVAILLPLTFTMDPTSAIVMLSCIYWGALFGGAITSILFNIPGEAWSVATTFDGYPMAQQGRAAEALTAAFTSSFIGSPARHHTGIAASRELRQGSHRGRVRARDGGACVRHLGAAADAGARHSRLGHRGDPARRPDGVGAQSRAAAVRRAQGFRLGPHRLDVSRQPLAPFTLALVLGNRAEDAFLSMIGSGGDLKVFWSNGLVGSITTLAILLLFWPAIDGLFGRVRWTQRSKSSAH